MADDDAKSDYKWVKIPVTESWNGVPVRLTGERWQHIIHRHPEMVDQRDRICETVSIPDYVQQGDFGELLAIRAYPDTPFGPRDLVVIYREMSFRDGFILAAYFSRRPSASRVILWKR